jgi:hypothetical protein
VKESKKTFDSRNRKEWEQTVCPTAMGRSLAASGQCALDIIHGTFNNTKDEVVMKKMFVLLFLCATISFAQS